MSRYWYVINGKKVLKRGICYSIYWYAKANNKYINDYGKNSELSYLQYWNRNNPYGWAMWQKLSVNNFEWIEHPYQFNKEFIKKYIEESDEDIFLKLMFNILKIYIIFAMIHNFYLKEWRLKKSKSLELIYMIKLNIEFT